MTIDFECHGQLTDQKRPLFRKEPGAGFALGPSGEKRKKKPESKTQTPRIPWPPQTVYVVGAGPGDPSLLTIKAMKILESADVVAYDDLLHPEILSYTKSHCQLIPVGYRGQIHQQANASRSELTQHHSHQESGAAENPKPRKERHPLVHPALIEAVKDGLKVVRLKCGDPMIFGRSAEEQEELRRFGIQCRYVPGITAALGAASHLGLPLTDRRYASQVTFQTATSEVKDKKTLVLYMPRNNLDSICASLVKEGWNPKTPVVFVVGATTRAEKLAFGTLDHLAPLQACRTSHMPGLVVIGETAGLFQHSFPDRKSAQGSFSSSGQLSLSPDSHLQDLQGMRILFLRATGAPSRLGDLLRKKGADLVEYPLFSLEPLLTGDHDEKEALREQVRGADGIVFRTCVDVRMFFRKLTEIGLDIRDLDPSTALFGLKAQVVSMLKKRGLQAFGKNDFMFLRQNLSQVLMPCALGEKIPPNFGVAQAHSFKTGEFLPRPWPCYRYRSRSFRVTAPDPHMIVVPHRRALDQFVSHMTREHPQDENHQDEHRQDEQLWGEQRGGEYSTFRGEEILGFAWREKPWTVFGPNLETAIKKLGVTGEIGVASSVETAGEMIEAFWDESLRIDQERNQSLTSGGAISEHAAEVKSQGTAASEVTSGREVTAGETSGVKSEHEKKGESPQGQVMVYTGQGKGKTTAALGLMVRALGQGLRVGVVQFIKGKWMTGERRTAAERFPEVPFKVMGKGFTWESDDLGQDRVLAQKAWEEARGMIQGGEYDVVILDEITYVLHYGFVALEEVLQTLSSRPSSVSVLLTGRRAPESLVNMADLVTEMLEVKHPFRKGQKAQRGLDY
jgi:cob(I)alamin adenosyltransferase